jgi:hypothetical protein
LGKRAVKAARRAEQMAAQAELGKRAVKAARRAEKMAAQAELGKRARHMAKEARKNASKLAQYTELADRASALANLATQVTADTVARAREALPIAS